MHFTQHGMDWIARRLFLPVMLLIDFGIFQYLGSVYYRRRREFRIQQLFVAAFIGFAALVYSHEDDDTMLKYNDVSETCAQLTFLIQITVIGYAVRTKVRLLSITVFTYLAEALIVVDWVNIILLVCDISGVEVGEGFHVFNNLLESITLLFVFVFRFYYLSMTHGFRAMARSRWLEIFAYFLVVTHEAPFALLGEITGVSWEYVQGIYMRCVIAWCILLNLKKKAKLSATSRQPQSTKMSVHPDEPLATNKVAAIVPSAPTAPKKPWMKPVKAPSSSAITQVQAAKPPSDGAVVDDDADF